MGSWAGGEPVCEGKADTVAAAVKELGAQLIGHSATDVEDAFQLMYRAGFYRGGPILTSALSGIEQAMWDIKGKALGVPVYELLGGKVRDQIEVYRWIGGDHPRDTGEEAKEAMAQGYRAVKMNVRMNCVGLIPMTSSRRRLPVWRPFGRLPRPCGSRWTSTGACIRRWPSS